MRFLIFLVCCAFFAVQAAQMASHLEQKRMLMPQQTKIFLYPTAKPIEKPVHRYRIPFILLYFIDYMCNKFCGD